MTTAQDLAKDLDDLFQREFGEILDRSQDTSLRERLADLQAKYVVYWTALQTGGGPGAERALKAIQGTVTLVMAREGEGLKTRAMAFLEGALAIGFRVLMASS